MNHSESIETIDRFIREGKISDAKQLLISINLKDLDRALIAKFADLARRLRMHFWGIRLLRPIVRPEKLVFPIASEYEKTVYAGLLIKVGANQEATQLLHPIATKSNPNALLFQSQILFSQWNYISAVPLLEMGIELSQLPPYQKAIFQVNLASAYLSIEETAKCRSVLHQLFSECEKNNWLLLLGNAFEIHCQLCILEKDFSQALKSINRSQELSGQHQRYSIFAEKWKLVAELGISNYESETTLKKIEHLKEKALEQSAWEVLRDIDFHIGRNRNHQNLLLNLYFGTPLVAYRKRIENIFLKNNWKIPNYFTRKLTSDPAQQLLNLKQLQVSRKTNFQSEIVLAKSMNEQLNLKKGNLLERLLSVLCLDFYRPLSIGEVHAWLYPEEHFHPDHSKEKISDAVKKLRRWLKENGILLDINVSNSMYSIKPIGPIALQASRILPTPKSLIQEKARFRLEFLNKIFEHRSFSTSQAAESLNMSLSLTRKFLSNSINQDLLSVEGIGRSRRYFFRKSFQKAS